MAVAVESPTPTPCKTARDAKRPAIELENACRESCVIDRHQFQLEQLLACWRHEVGVLRLTYIWYLIVLATLKKRTPTNQFLVSRVALLQIIVADAARISCRQEDGDDRL